MTDNKCLGTLCFVNPEEKILFGIGFKNPMPVSRYWIFCVEDFGDVNIFDM